MEEIVRGAVLGVLQGLTEFFPVSSSGHLIFVPRLFGWDDQGLAFDTILHVGTLFALVWVFWHDITKAVVGTVKRDRVQTKLTFMVIAAAIPGVVIGGLFNEIIESNLRGPMIVAFGLAFWGLVLWVADIYASKRKKSVTDTKDLTWTQAMVIGFSQAIALVPGTSRSGITMTGGLFSGLNRSTAVTFSFLISIPTIAAAGLYGFWKILQQGVTVSMGIELAIGFIVAAGSGIWAIRFLRSYVAKHSFLPFIIYRFALAALIFIVL